ncbi:hypothetical protein ACCQ23_00670 [Xanthomonas axonopodis pv. phyllanthi]|uniref:hypothetical protein n=1 Tax=Xanthomonas axonopodis TaxID=53413 RepID=UPI003555E59B
MALVYCADKQSGHCFSLTRFPDEDAIEVMVIDQVNSKVLDLDVTLDGRCLLAQIPPDLSRKIGGIEQYIVHLDLPDDELPVLVSALQQIFSGKSGLKFVTVARSAGA